MKQIITVIILFFLSVHLFAQRMVNGVVTDAATDETLTGVTVKVKGTKNGAVTDLDGKYQVELPEGANTLIFSYTGRQNLELKVGATNLLNAQMEEGSSSINQVTVVGTRGKPRVSTDKATPVDAINARELRSFSQVNISDILTFVTPSFNSNRQTVTDGTDHLDPASLRGLGPDQVLVLVNGKRRHTSALVNINGSVGRGSVGTDMNVIPVAAIERIEVLRDGAAAQYGSDAIAGVINVVLKKNYEGLSASLTTGVHVTNMEYEVPNTNGRKDQRDQKLNDGEMVQLDLVKGFRLGREGALTVTAQYNQRGSTNRSGEDHAPTIYLGSAGTFPSTPVGEEEAAFRKELIQQDASLVLQNNYDRHNMVFGNSSSRNIGVFVNGATGDENKPHLYFTGGYTHRTGKAFGNNRIPVSRAQQPLRADGTLLYPNGFLPAIAPTIQDASILIGYKTNLGQLNVDLSNTFGQNQFHFGVRESGNASLPEGTSPTQFDAGTLRFAQNTTNLDFSRKHEQMGSLEDFNIAFGGEFRYEKYMIEAGEDASYIGADLKKSVPLAPLTINGPSNGTTLALPGSQVFPGFQPSDKVSESRNSVGVYADLEGELFGRWLLAAAGRFENYSDFGSNLNGKLATRINLLKTNSRTIAVRGSVSTGFRAPSLHQKYFQNTSTQFVSGLPSNTLTVNNENPISRNVIGVDELRPETSVSATVGVTASLQDKFTLTVDAYLIKIEDRIVYSGAFSRSLLGFADSQYVGINNVNFFANAANTTTRGLDVVLIYKTDLTKGQLTATAALNFNKNEVTAINSTELIDSPAKNDPAVTPDNWFRNRLFDRQQQSRIEVFQPRNKINLSLSYSIKKFNVTLRTVRFGEISYVHNLDTEAKKQDGTFWNTQFSRDADGKAFIDQTFSPIWITDLILSVRLNDHFNIAIGTNNLFDVYPDQIFIDPRNAIGSIDYNSGRDASNRGRFLFQPNQGGFNGRFIFARLTANF